MTVTKTIIVRLPDEMHKAFRLATVKRGENMTEVIRRAIAAYLKGEGNEND